MNKSVVLFLILFGIILTKFLGDFLIVDAGYLLVGLIAFYLNRNHVNILGLIYIVLAVRSAEYLTWLVWDTRSAYIIYPVQFLLDLTVIYLITYRWEIYLRFNPSADPKEIVFTHADYFLKNIYKLYLLVISVAFMEHVIRNIDDFGFPEEWSNPDLLFMYNYIIPIRYTLNVIEYILILGMAHQSMRSAKVLPA